MDLHFRPERILPCALDAHELVDGSLRSEDGQQSLSEDEVFIEDLGQVGSIEIGSAFRESRGSFKWGNRGFFTLFGETEVLVSQLVSDLGAWTRTRR